MPYEKANIPQAWAAAVPLLAAQLFLSLVPDAPRKRCFIAPWLPEWLPRLQLQGIRIGDGALDVAIARDGEKTIIEAEKGARVEIVHAAIDVPLMGAIA